MYKSTGIIVSLLSLLTIGGCSHFDKDYGASTTHNMNVQTISAYARYEEAPVSTLDGQKGEHVLTNYRTEESTVDTSTLLEGLDSGD